MHHAKNRGNKEIPLAILSRILYSTIMRNPLAELCREGLRMLVLVSLTVLLRGFPCCSHGAPLHPSYLNDFYSPLSHVNGVEVVAIH